VCMKHGAKIKRCSYEGCTNQVVKGGVCKKHGAKVNLCSSEGCTNHAKKGGVCWRHGANRRNPHEESTAFTSCFGSEFEKTTATHPTPRASTASTSNSVVPGVVVCSVITENYEEV
jgi:hypothetical protein